MGLNKITIQLNAEQLTEVRMFDECNFCICEVDTEQEEGWAVCADVILADGKVEIVLICDGYYAKLKKEKDIVKKECF